MKLGEKALGQGQCMEATNRGSEEIEEEEIEDKPECQEMCPEDDFSQKVKQVIEKNKHKLLQEIRCEGTIYGDMPSCI